MPSEELIEVDRTVHHAGHRLAVRWIGATEGPQAGRALVLLHEGLGCITLWKDFPRLLVAATGLPALLYDRQGHGLSAPLTAPRGLDYLHRHALEELPAVLEAEGVEDPVLVGHSDGATIALLYAARFSPRAVVAVAAHVNVEQAALTGIRQTLARWDTGELEVRLARHHGANTRSVFFAWADTWLAPWFARWDIQEALSAIRCPCLLIQGEKDPYATPEHLALIARGIAAPVRAELVAEAHHSPHLEAPEATMKLVTPFLTRIAAPGPRGDACP